MIGQTVYWYDGTIRSGKTVQSPIVSYTPSVDHCLVSETFGDASWTKLRLIAETHTSLDALRDAERLKIDFLIANYKDET